MLKLFAVLPSSLRQGRHQGNWLGWLQNRGLSRARNLWNRPNGEGVVNK